MQHSQSSNERYPGRYISKKSHLAPHLSPLTLCARRSRWLKCKLVFWGRPPGYIPSGSERAASNASGRHRQRLDALDTALLRPDALDPPHLETLPPAPSLFLPLRLKAPFPCCRSADAFQPQALTSRPPPPTRRPGSFPPMILSLH